jgi:hypothetical protein
VDAVEAGHRPAAHREEVELYVRTYASAVAIPRRILSRERARIARPWET